MSAVRFWSYVRDDDEVEAARITKMTKQTADQFQIATGNEIEVFVDREAIAWGDLWSKRIDEAVAGTTFLIPIGPSPL